MAATLATLSYMRRFSNGTKFIDLSKVVTLTAPYPFPGSSSADVVFTTVDGKALTINMTDSEFASLALPIN